MADLGQMVVRIVGDNTQFKQAVDDTKTGFEGIKVAAVAMAAIVTREFVRLVNDTVKYGSSIFDAAQKTGLSTDAIQKWKFIAEQTGTTLETVTGAVAQMTRNLDVNEKKFKDLGVTLKNNDGTYRSITDIFDDTIMKLAGMKDATLRDSLTFDLLGRSAQNMIPIIKEGASGLKRMGDEASALGIIIDEKTITNTEALGDSAAALKTATRAAGMSIAGTLAPALKSVTDEAAGTLKGMVRAKNAAKDLRTEAQAYDDFIAGKGNKNLDYLLKVQSYIQGQIQALSTSRATIGQIQALGLDKQLQQVNELIEAARRLNAAFQAGADQSGVAMDNFVGTVESAIVSIEDGTKRIGGAWDRLGEKIRQDAADWGDVVNTLASSMSNALGGAFEAIGGALAEDKDAWKNWGKLALRAVADILRALAAQLAAFVALNLAKIPPSFGKAATAAAGAAAALVAAGAVDAYAGQLAEGGIVKPRTGGVAAVVAEAGEAEAVIPLSKLDSMLAGRGLSDESGGMTHLVVQIDSRPILDKIFGATKNKTVLISAGAVV